MADLEVDLDLLAETAGSLGMLVHEFDKADVIVSDAAGAVGRNELLDELHDFVSEWKHKREKLLDSLQAVYEMATKSHQAYVDADNHLASSIADAVQAGRS